MIYPTYEELVPLPGPDLFQVRRAFRSVVSHMVGFFFSGLILILMHLFFSDAEDKLFGLVSVRWLAIIPALFLLEIFRKYHDNIYVFGRYNVTHYEGRLSLNSSVPALKYMDILGISIEQDLVGRFLDYGNILLDSAGDTGVEMTISGVRAPGKLAKLIERLRIHSTEEAGFSPPVEE